MVPSTDLLTDLSAAAGTTHTTCRTIHHKILDQISEIVVDTKAVITTKADKISTETTTEVEGTSKTTSTIRGMDSRTGMIKIDLTTGDDQTNINTTKTNQKHR